ncbi:MAG: GNAT family N-acetyltransferase [Armatimonadetes bacterium]|nr:GNAT family N-acetyltransferase [Armatimonadota bacterium]
MPDMLVKLYALPDDRDEVERLADEGIIIRRVQPYEASVLKRFVLSNFSEVWADEAGRSFSFQPVSCIIATHEKQIVGFGCYDTTCRGFFGPTGVLESYRGKGIGKALLLACLRAMRESGYGYAIIGGAGPMKFYEKAVGAVEIPGSAPGIYTDMLKRDM